MQRMKMMATALAVAGVVGCAPAFTPGELEVACSQIHNADKRTVFDAILDGVPTDTVEANYDAGIISVAADMTTFGQKLWFGAATKVQEKLTFIILDVQGETKVRLKGSRQMNTPLGWGHSERNTYQSLTPKLCREFHDKLRARV